MQCPACGNNLKEKVVSGVTVDICEHGCGGIWFDNFEIKKFDEPHETSGEEILNIQRNPHVVVDRNQRLKCPKCSDIVMMRHFFSIKKEVEIDECPGCGGIWLDVGELARIRELFETEQQRHQAAKEYFNEVFGEEFAKMEAEDLAKSEKVRKFANVFKWICPSHYIPGKQTWGAF